MSALRRILASLLLLALLAPAARAGEAGALDAAGLRKLVADATAAGAVAVVNYWATWCGPCRDEMPHLRALRREFRADELFLVGVSLDLDEASYRAFVRSHPFGYPTAFGGERLMEELGVRAIPRTEIYAPGGALHKVYDGQVDEGALRREIKSLLRRGAGGRP
ncbi:MAG: TlpA disulfide reductase family protein [Thermodesulfobacteriota bacterium]